MTPDDSNHVLSPRAASALRTLGDLPAQVLDPHLAAAVCDLEATDAEQVMGELADAGRIVPSPQRDGRNGTGAEYTLAQAREAAEPAPPAAREEPLRRWTEYLLAAATRAEQRLTPSHRTMPRTPRHVSDTAAVTGLSDRDLLDWLQRRSIDFKSAIALAYSNRWYDMTVQVVDAMWPLLLRRRDLDLWVTVVGSYGLPAAKELAARPGLSPTEQAEAREMVRRMLTTLAGGLRNAGRIEEAQQRYQEALDGARADGHLRDQAQALNGLGGLHGQAGRHEEAVGLLVEALRIREEIGYTRGAALTRIRLGEIATDLDRHHQAIEYLVSARTVLLRLDEPDPYDAARALALLGRVYLLAERFHQGENHMVNARIELEAAGALPWAARTFEWLADAARKQGHTGTARVRLTEARVLYARAHSPADLERVDQALVSLLGDEQDH